MHNNRFQMLQYLLDSIVIECRNHEPRQNLFFSQLWKNLLASVVNFSEEVFGFISISVSLKPKGEDGKVTNKKNGKKTGIINSEPLVCSVGGNSSSGGKDGRHKTGDSGNNSLLKLWGLHGHGKRGNSRLNTEGYVIERTERRA